MESIEQFKDNVKNNERRLNFFINKLKGDLKRINIDCPEEIIRNMILESIDSYNDMPHLFANYAINYIKGNLKQESKYPKNDIFYDTEMAILELYLEKNEKGQYRSTEEIAKALNTEISTVSSTVYKLKTEFSEHPKDIEKIFGNITHIIIEHKKMKPTRKKKTQGKNIKLTDEDLKILGQFTGQINDICIDIEDLANERGITTEKMKERIIDLYDLLENEENYKTLKEKFPQINLMLKFKGRSIGAKIPIIVTTNGNPVYECANFFQTLYEKDKDGKYISVQKVMMKLGYNKKSTLYSRKKVLEKQLEEDLDFRRKVIERYPTLLEDKEEYKQTSNRGKKQARRKKEPELSEKIKQDVELLKYFYKLHNGKYYDEAIIAELMEMKTYQVIKKRDKILNQMNKNKKYRTQILNQYPELYKNIEVYNKAPDEQKHGGVSPKVIAKDVKYLRLMYTKNSSNKYRLGTEIVNELGVSINTFGRNKERILKELDNNSEYKNAIIKEYPLLEYNINMYLTYKDNEKKAKEEMRKKEKEAKEEEKLSNLIKTLEYFFKKRPNGTYYEYSEIAELLGIKENSVYTKQSNTLKKLEDKELKEKVLKKWPTLEEDIKKRPSSRNNPKPKNISERIDKDVETLEYLYKKQPDGNYLSNEEIADLLNIKTNSIWQTKRNILIRLENEEYKAKILEKYPTLDEDITERNSESTELTKKEKDLANMLLTDETRVFQKVTSYARHLDISNNYFNILKNNTVTKISNNPNLQNDYPHFREESEIAANHSKTNSISISQEELNNIRRNSRNYDIPNTKRNSRDNLIKGISKLEKSVYGDYASLCTVEQKAMLALKLGFFNNMEFSTESISIFFMTEQEEVSKLTKECLRTTRNKLTNKNAQKKIGTKN